MSVTPDSSASAASAADPAPPQEWKPEPRQWTWKDLFTAPMLAFKLKCMLISALTLLALGAWSWLFETFSWKLYMDPGGHLWYYLAEVVWFAVGAVIYSIGATLVAVFMRADLLDDEFLSLREALGQFKTRLAPALLVPLFLLALLAGVNLFLIYVPELLCSIPYAGSLLYALLYPVGYFLALFAVLLLIAVVLSVFVFPGIIAIRKHGWFDNVVDTIEAVGTKPHVLVGSLVLTLILMTVAFRIGNAGMDYLRVPPRDNLLPSRELTRTEDRADEVRFQLLNRVDPLRHLSKVWGLWMPDLAPASAVDTPPGYGDTYRRQTRSQSDWDAAIAASDERLASGETAPSTFSTSWYTWGTGLVTGIWKTLILVIVLGYCMSLAIGGGMLTYLLVREDDYWDDEDLEDLDKLAKELEEEAKRDDAAVAPSTPAAPPAAAPAPVTPPTPPATA